jgi:predicted small lipoprotein YifL
MRMVVTSAVAMALVVGLGALAGCGRVQPLRATSDMKPVPPAWGSNSSASADALIGMTPQGRPNRDDEPLTRSQPRPVDPFDLPPGQ